MPRYTLITSYRASNSSDQSPDDRLITCDVNSCAAPEGLATSTLDSVEYVEVRHGDDSVVVTLLDLGPPLLLAIDGKPYEVVVDDSGQYRVIGSSHSFRVGNQRTAARIGAIAADGVYAPMPGRVVKLLCEVGDVVERGAALVVLEAMKMENELVAPARGRVTEVLTSEGSAVEARTKLVALTEA